MWRSRFGRHARALLQRRQQPRVVEEHARGCGCAIASSAVAPVAPAASGHEHLGRDRVAHQLEQLVARVEVVVERHRARPQLARDPPHRDRLEPLLVGDRAARPARSALRDSGARGPRPRGSGSRPDRRLRLLDIRTVYPYRTPYYDVHRTNPTAASPRARPALRRHRGAEPGWTCGRGRARCSACSATTAPARRPPCASSRRCSPPPAAARSSPATTSSPSPRAVRESISLAGQQATLDERLTGRENLMLLGAPADGSPSATRSRARAALLARFGIEHAADRQVGTYSGGMRRRLDLAACLVVHRPGRLPRRADDRPGPGAPGRHVGRDRGPRGGRRRARC